MERSKLIGQVQLRIDELTPFEGLALSIDGTNDKPIDMFINGLLDEAVRDVLLRAKLSRVPFKRCVNRAVSYGNGSGNVLLPPDFLRLLRFKMREWKRPVYQAIEASDPVYKMQFNEFDRGGTAKPVCALTEVGGFRVLEYFSVNGLHEIEEFEYVPVLAAEEVNDELTDVLVWACAAKVLQVTGNKQAEAAYKMTTELLNN